MTYQDPRMCVPLHGIVSDADPSAIFIAFLSLLHGNNEIVQNTVHGLFIHCCVRIIKLKLKYNFNFKLWRLSALENIFHLEELNTTYKTAYKLPQFIEY
jgi:hypothetical protein